MGELLTSILSLTFLAQVLRITVPYALAAMGGSISERSGVIDIALEGKLLMGAFCAALGAYYAPASALAIPFGVLCGAAGGVAVSIIYAVVVVRFRADQIVAGVAINMMAYGLTRYLLTLIFESSSNSPPVPGFSGHVLANWVFYLAVLLAIGSYILIARTPFGLRVRAVGDHPEAADTLGISVPKIRWIAILLSGGLAGIGGAWLSLSASGFVGEMSNGRGYIALAAVIMGSWRPQWAVAACLLFGFAEALQLNLQTSGVGVPGELVQMLPYLLTVVVLAGFIGRSRPPAAIGKPYPE